ncbi:MAG: hypothetical protein IKQ61_08020 [Spirochaetales bacterium]|nr:hypothetical protein [Spirochaetales bacterium]
MKLICKTEGAKVYDAGEDYIMKIEDGQERIIPKEKNFTYPLSLVWKGDYEIVDEKYFRNLESKLSKKK